jgi:RNA-binding protein
MQLTAAQIRYLRSLGHKLKPLVMIGANGLTDAVIEETDSTIEFHELIKVRVSVGDRELRDQIIAELCDKTRSALIQRIGNMALIFRRNANKPKIDLKLARKT